MKNLSGLKFGRLTFQSLSFINDLKQKIWLCSCDCGKEKLINQSHILSGNTKSCGCLLKEITRHKGLNDLTQNRYGKLLVIKHSGYIPVKSTPKKHTSLWECLCDCGKTILIKHGDLSMGKRKSCGCLKHLRGKDNPHWNHNVDDEQRIRRESRRETVEYKNWRKSVFVRDNFTCVLSGTKKEIQAHHLNGWCQFPEIRFEVDNGVTLNKYIHILFHNLYGKKNNTLDQFLQFSKDYQTDNIHLKLDIPLHLKILTLKSLISTPLR